MTTETIILLNTIGGIACFFVPAIQLITNTDEEGLKKISPVGWIMFVVAFYLLGVGISSYYVSKGEKEHAKYITDSTTHANDSISVANDGIRKADKNELIATFQKALKEKNQRLDLKTGKIISAEEPNLNIDIGPRITSLRGDTIMIGLSVKNFGNSEAKNISLGSVTVYKVGADFEYSAGKTKQNELLAISANQSYAIYLPYHGRERTIAPGTEYVYLKIDYTNKNNINQPPFRQILPFPQNIKLNEIVYDLESEEYNKVKQFLISKKLW